MQGVRPGPGVRHNTMWMQQAEPGPELHCQPPPTPAGGGGLSREPTVNKQPVSYVRTQGRLKGSVQFSFNKGNDTEDGWVTFN